MKTFALICIAALLSCAAKAQLTASMSITGTTWSVNPLSSTITNAGRNYTHSESSGTGQTLISANALVGWQVSVQLSVTSGWDPSLKLYVKRTGNGNGGAVITDGTTDILLTNVPQKFFSGLLGIGFARTNVPVQYRIDGLSVLLPVKTYTATVLYTISGL